MSATFWCDFELARFPVSELVKDKNGNLIHQTSTGPCHYPNGNVCWEQKPPIFELTQDEVNELPTLLPDRFNP
jgi:hypothetical protein